MELDNGKHLIKPESVGRITKEITFFTGSR